MKKRLLLACTVLSAVLTMTACGGKVEVQVAEPVTQVEDVAELVEETEDAEQEEAVTEPEVSEAEEEISAIDLEDGVYLADFDTDSSMFHVNEACNGKGILTVENGKATIHIALTSKNIVNLFEGTVENLDESKLLQPVPEEVTYSDGTSEEVNAFDVNVPYLDEEFDLALIGKKGVWYDHKVSVSNPEPYVEENADGEESENAELTGDTVNVTLTGGSGKATVDSPAMVSVNDAGQQIVTIVWSSPNYDYMIVGGEKLLPVNTEGNSTFEIPVSEIPCTIDVIADTVAMSKPHEVEYTLSFEK